ncbi:hypothetical protein [uncultured Paracoccus sp.]|uniref:hypothetical protein n=1 Tax=uncultured Paracoccus sp. TaxID=189685 RepID=UPI00263A14C4|nr:hypothetical protein [uncultured Paracoccus sp.]
MKPVAIAVLLSSLLVLTACGEAEVTNYPMSGEPCSPDDPVQTMEASDCVPPV